MGPKRENKLRYQKFREIEISRKKTFNEAATLIYKNIVSSPLVLLLIIIIILLLKQNSSTIMEKNNNTTVPLLQKNNKNWDIYTNLHFYYIVCNKKEACKIKRRRNARAFDQFCPHMPGPLSTF